MTYGPRKLRDHYICTCFDSGTSVFWTSIDSLRPLFSLIVFLYLFIVHRNYRSFCLFSLFVCLCGDRSPSCTDVSVLTVPSDSLLTLGLPAPLCAEGEYTPSPKVRLPRRARFRPVLSRTQSRLLRLTSPLTSIPVNVLQFFRNSWYLP